MPVRELNAYSRNGEVIALRRIAPMKESVGSSAPVQRVTHAEMFPSTGEAYFNTSPVVRILRLGESLDYRTIDNLQLVRHPADKEKKHAKNQCHRVNVTDYFKPTK